MKKGKIFPAVYEIKIGTKIYSKIFLIHNLPQLGSPNRYTLSLGGIKFMPLSIEETASMSATKKEDITFSMYKVTWVLSNPGVYASSKMKQKLLNVLVDAFHFSLV